MKAFVGGKVEGVYSGLCNGRCPNAMLHMFSHILTLQMKAINEGCVCSHFKGAQTPLFLGAQVCKTHH